MVYKVPFVNYPEHYRRIWDETMSSITEVLTNGDLIMRDQLKQFEENLASFVGAKYAIGLNSGTDALLLSLRAADISSNDEVITVAHTFVATIATIVQCGAKPVLIDVDEDMNMDTSQIRGAITSKTKAIIPVHLNGRMCNMDDIRSVAENHDLTVIEDAAQSLGASFSNKRAGSFGLAGCFSFYPAKMLGAAGDGGAVTTNDERMADTIRLLRDHALQRSTGELLCYGYNSRLDNLQAAILNVKLKHLPSWIKRRREIAHLYHRGLSDLSELVLPPSPQSNTNFFDVFQNYVIRSEERDKLVAYLRDSGIETLISWPKPTHRHEALGLTHFDLPVTERISREVLSLPMYPELSNEQVDYIINIFYNFKGS